MERSSSIHACGTIFTHIVRTMFPGGNCRNEVQRRGAPAHSRPLAARHGRGRPCHPVSALRAGLPMYPIRLRSTCACASSYGWGAICCHDGLGTVPERDCPRVGSTGSNLKRGQSPSVVSAVLREAPMPRFHTLRWFVAALTGSARNMIAWRRIHSGRFGC